MSRNVKISLIVTAFGLLILLSLLLAEAQKRTHISHMPRAHSDVDIGGPFTLVDQTGTPRTEADFAAKPMLIYFGFTYCPDVCPLSLDVMSAALDELNATAPETYDALAPLFISVDPHRDTPDQMADYLSYFHPKITGLTGTPDQIDAVKKAFRIYAVRRDDSEAYNIDHSSFFYLMDGAGRYLAHFTHTLAPDVLAQKIHQTLVTKKAVK